MIKPYVLGNMLVYQQALGLFTATDVEHATMEVAVHRPNQKGRASSDHHPRGIGDSIGPEIGLKVAHGQDFLSGLAAAAE